MEEGQKPVQGLPSGGFQSYRVGEGGKIQDVVTFNDPLDTTANLESARVGDYYYDTNGRLQVWKDSPTDLVQRYKIAIGGTEKPNIEANLASVGVGAVSGGLTGLLAGPAAPFTVPLGAIAGVLNAYNNAAKEAVEAWKNEDVKYDSAVEFYKDEDGNLKYKLDYSKMATAGPRSGSSVKEAQKAETTVRLGDDGRLKITANPIFATTSRFQEIIDFIADNYSTLNKNTENLDEVLDTIRQAIQGETDQFVMNTSLYADYANRFEADKDIIVASYTTEIAGYVNPENMKDYDVAFINDNNEIETGTSEYLFDKVLAMSKDDRSRLVQKLSNIIENPDNEFTENERAVAYGELKSLWAVSANPEKYENDKYAGMMDADFMMSVISSFNPLGINVTDALNFVSGGKWFDSKQEYLNQNDLAVFVGAAGAAAASLGIFKAGSSLIEKALSRLPFTSQLFQASLEGQGGALAFFAQNTGNTEQLLRAAGATAAFKTLKVGIFDAAVAGTKSLVSGANFADEFGKDFAIDATLEAMFSYYDMVKFQNAVVDNKVYAFVNPETGNLEYTSKRFADVTVTEEGDVLDLAFKGGSLVTPSGDNVAYAEANGSKFYYYNGNTFVVTPDGKTATKTDNIMPALQNGVVVNGENISSALKKAGYKEANILLTTQHDLDSAIAARKAAKIGSTKVGLAVSKALFNKNAALDVANNMALAKTADRNAWQESQEYFVNVWQNSEREMSYIKTGEYGKDAIAKFDAYTNAFGKLNIDRKYSQADANYLKAIIQIERAQYLQNTAIPGDDTDYVKEAMTKYASALTGVSADRAEVLNQFSEIRKARHDATKKAAIASGWLDEKRLNKLMESEMQKTIGWVPQWKKKETYAGLLDRYYGISQERNFVKDWVKEGEWVDLDMLEDPIVADERFLSFVTTNMGINHMKDEAVRTLTSAGLIIDETKTKPTAVKNKEKLVNKFNELVEAKKKEVEKTILSEKQYAEAMQKIVEDGGAIEAITKAVKDKTKTELAVEKLRSTLDKAAGYNNEIGYEFDVESYMNTSVIPRLTEIINSKNVDGGAALVNQAILDVAPYHSREAVLKSQMNDVAKSWRAWAYRNVQMPGSKDEKKLALDNLALEINNNTTDAYTMGAAEVAGGLGGRYPINWFRNGKPCTIYLKYDTPEQQRLAEEITHIFNDKELIKQPGAVTRIAGSLANTFRLLNTTLDFTRAPLNYARDTLRSTVTAGGESFVNPSELIKQTVDLGNYADAEKTKLKQKIDNAAKLVAGETYNKAYRDKKSAQVAITQEYLSKNGAPLKHFIYNVQHDKLKLLETPADFFEGLTRKRLAKSAAAVALRKAQLQGKSFDEQLKIIENAANFAGREYTANFARKGTIIGATSRYVAYQSSAYAGLDGLLRAYINNPKAVTQNFALFLTMYLIILADALSDEESRRSYYSLSDWDRGNSINVALGDGGILSIPLDQDIAAFLFPYRRLMETLNGVDPVSFFELMWGTFTEPMPFDLSGFSEGGAFNLRRGLEKLLSQNMPTGFTGLQEATTGYDLYYGSDLRVTDEMLKDYGIYDPQAGDYTTASKNSKFLRAVANATGIPQWQLQVLTSSYGANVGQYVLNIIDKLAGATEAEQGGKSVADAIFKSFTGSDQDTAYSEFYDGINQLKTEKRKVIQAIANENKNLETATGDARVEIQNKIQKIKDDYATKVGDFVDSYVSAYEITGGLPKTQAMQIYYLFRFDDDDTVYQAGSVAEYYQKQALQDLKNEATDLAAPILDKYYSNRIGNIYQDSNGDWKHYLSYGAQAMKNKVYGEAEQQKVDLLNILEGSGSSLKTLRRQVQDARSEAYDAGAYDIADGLAYELDRRVVAAIKPYIDQYGAENVLGNSEVLDYLSDWFIVPSDFEKSKYGKNVSLGHNASKQEAFVRPFIKYIFGLPTNYTSYGETQLNGAGL